MKLSLTDLTLRRLPLPAKGQKAYFKSNGLGVRVSQGGTKTFVAVRGPERK
jgi:hypothetical protein